MKESKCQEIRLLIDKLEELVDEIVMCPKCNSTEISPMIGDIQCYNCGYSFDLWEGKYGVIEDIDEFNKILKEIKLLLGE